MAADPKSLRERDGAALGLVDAVIPSHAAVQAEESPDEDAQYRGHHLRVIGQTVAQGEGHRKNPLACRNMGKDAIHQVGCGIGHTPSATGRTHAAAFAGQRQEPLLSARFTLEPQETTGQHPTRQVCPHLALDKLRNLAAAFLLASEKRFQMGRDCPIQQRFFRIPWAVLIFVIGSRSNTGMIRSRHGRRDATHTPPAGPRMS